MIISCLALKEFLLLSLRSESILQKISRYIAFQYYAKGLGLDLPKDLSSRLTIKFLKKQTLFFAATIFYLCFARHFNLKPKTMKKLFLIFSIALFLIFITTNNINKQFEDQDCILNDSALFFYNQFVSNFGGIQEEDMDSVINFYTKTIQTLDDTLNLINIQTARKISTNLK